MACGATDAGAGKADEVVKGVAINDDPEREHEANVLGEKGACAASVAVPWGRSADGTEPKEARSQRAGPYTL